MAQLSIPYTLVGPDGTRVVWGNSDAAKADPDYIGWLNPDDGITGLDSAQVREVAEDGVAEDGGTHGNFLFGRRTVTFAGMINPNGSMATINALEEKVRQASFAMRADATLTWTPDGSPARRLLLRRQVERVGTGRRPKGWFLSLVSAAWQIDGAVEKSVSRAVAGPTVMMATNAGTAASFPRFELTGPLNNATVSIRNHHLPGSPIIYKTKPVVLNAGQVLAVDFKTGKVTVGGAPRGGLTDFMASPWTPLRAGTNNLEVLTSVASDLAWTVFFRDAWV
ncbi:MAG: hypothetical protein WKF96_00095 [Solirubrobacteraceae bacterium]